jgi:hypothetical protein
MSLTITIPGAVDVTTGSTAPAVLTIGVGVPGAQGPQGPAGPGVPAGGTSGQFLQKTSGTDYATDWVTVTPFISAVTSPLSVTSGNLSVNLSSYLTTSAAASTYYLQTNPAGYITSSALVPYLLGSTAASTYQTLAGMSSYLTTSAAASTYATIAQGQPASGTIGQVLTKNSGTNYDSSWQTLIPGDRYLTSSTTSLTINNANKTLTVGTGLSYTPTQSITISYDASNHMHGEVLTYNSGTGVLTVDINHHTGSGTYASWVVNVGGVVPATSVTWGSITGTLGDQTDLATALNAKLATADAATTYAPIASPTFTGTVTIPAGASISGFAPLASPALTGNVTIVSNSTGPALFIEQAGTGNILTLHDQATDTNFVAIDANGKINTIPADATTAGLNIPHTATAPTTPINGDIWTTTSGLFARISGGTQQYAALGSNVTFSNSSSTFGSSTAAGTINVASGATISASTKTVNVATGGVVGSTTNTTIGPVLGASTTSIGGTTAASTLNLATGATLTATTKAVNIGTAGVAGSTTNIAIGSTTGTSTTTLQGTTNITGNLTTTGTVTDIANSTAAQQINIGAGSTVSGSTKTISIGNNGASGSTTNVNIATSIGGPSGSATINIGNITSPPTTTTNLYGTINAPTPAADTNSTVVATTAFVVGQAGSATPLVNGTAAVGTSLRYARQDHVHGTDTTRAPLASPTFTGTVTIPAGASISGFAPLASPSLTGTPLSTTAAVDTNTTQIATTAFVVGQAASATPLVNGTAAVGTSLRFARADHVHPTDTTRAPLASPAFSGTPSLPTGTTAVTQTAGNNTTAVATTAFVQAALPVVATTAQINSPLNNTALMTPSAARQMMLFPGFQQFLAGGSSGTSGTGAVAPSATARWRQFQGPNVSTAGYSTFVFDTQNSGIGFVGSKRGVGEYGKNFARALWMSGRTLIGTDDGGFGGDVNNLYRCELGGRNSMATSGEPTHASLGWRVAGGGSQAIVFYMRTRQNVNGGTYTETTTSFSPVYSQWFDWMVTYNGTDTCQMFVNDTLVGTISANFNGFQGETYNFYSERIEQTASAATRLEVNTLPPRIYFSE